MDKKVGFVVINKDGNLFYCNGRKYTDDINKAKDFNSRATASRIAKKINGYVRELNYRT